MHLNLDDLAARLMEQLRVTEHQFIGLQAQLALINQLREEAHRVAAATTPDSADAGAVPGADADPAADPAGPDHAEVAG